MIPTPLLTEKVSSLWQALGDTIHLPWLYRGCSGSGDGTGSEEVTCVFQTPTLSHQPCPTGLSPPLTSGTTCSISRPRVHTHRSRTWPGPSLHTSLWGAPWVSMSPTRRTEQCPVCCLPGCTGWGLRWSRDPVMDKGWDSCSINSL